MSDDWRNINKPPAERKEQDKLPEKQEKPGSAGTAHGNELNLLNVQGQTHAQSTKPEAKPSADEKKPARKEEPGSLFSVDGAMGTLKGAGKALLSLPQDAYRAVVNPSYNGIYSQINGNKPGRLGDQAGLSVSLNRTVTDMGTGLHYLATHPGQVYNKSVESYTNASSEKKGVMFGQSITLAGTLFWGTGLSGKAGKLFGLGRAEEGVAGVRALTELSEAGKLNAARDLSAFARTGNAARLADEMLLTGRLGENTRFLNLAREARSTAAGTELAAGTDARMARIIGDESMAGKVKTTSDALLGHLDYRKLLASESGGVVATAEQRALLEKGFTKINDSLGLALEKGPESVAGRIAMRELRQSVQEYKTLAALDVRAAANVDRALLDLEQAVSGRQAGGLAGRLGLTEGQAALESGQQSLTKTLSAVREDLSISGKAEDLLAARRSSELEESMRKVATAVDPASREQALVSLERNYKAYTEALKDSTIGRAGKVDMVAVEKAYTEFRSAAAGDLTAVNRAYAFGEPGAAGTEALFARQNELKAHLSRTGELTAGSETAEMQALRRSAREVEESMAKVSNAADAAARQRALSEFELKYKSYANAVKESSLGKNGLIDLRATESCVAEFRAAAKGGAELTSTAESQAFRYSLSQAENAAARQELVQQQIGRARELYAGSNSTEAQMILQEGQRLEASLRQLNRAERVVVEAARGDAAIAKYSSAARDNAALSFDARLKAWDELTGSSKVAKTAGVDLTFSQAAVADLSTGGLTARRVGQVLDSGAASRTETFGARLADLSDGAPAIKAEGAITGSAPLADATALSRARGSLDLLTASDASAVFKAPSMSARLSEAAGLGDGAVVGRVQELRDCVSRLDSLVASAVKGSEVSEALVQLRNGIRAYNEAVDASAAVTSVKAGLRIDESLVGLQKVDRLTNLTPSLYGDGAALYLREKLAQGTRGPLDAGSLENRLDFSKLPRTAIDDTAWWRSTKVKLESAVDKAVSDVFYGGSMVQGIAKDGFLNYLRSFIPTSGSDWLLLAKGYTLIIGSGIVGIGREVNSQTADNRAGGQTAESGRAAAQGSDTNRAGTAGQAGDANRAGTAGQAGDANRAGAAGLIGDNNSLKTGAAGAVGDARRDAAGQEKAAYQQAVPGERTPAMSPIIQALSLPNLASQAVPRGVIAEQSRSNPSWWSTVFGVDSGVRPLLKADETRPEEAPKVPVVFQLPRRIGGGDGNSQRVVTPTFNPSFIRMQSELLGNSKTRFDGKSLAVTAGERKARGMSTSNVPDDEKLLKQFPFLVAHSGGENGVTKQASRFAAGAEDQEHKNMGQLSGSASGAQSGGQEEGASPLLVAANSQQPAARNNNDEDEKTSSQNISV